MQEFSRYYAGDKEAKEYQIKLAAYTLLIYMCFATFVMSWINVWWMAAIVSVSVTRWMIAFHELFHLRKPEALDYFTRLQIIPFAPLNLGYREYRNIHIGHHQHTATEKDPDAFHILGGSFKALLGAVSQHEQAAFRYIAANGLSRELVTMMIIRFTIFTVLLLAFPTDFLIWWLVLRLTYIVNDFVFFHLVHYRSGHNGTFSIPLPSIIVYPAVFIYGMDVVYATMHHDAHHKHTMVAAKYLPEVAGLEK